MRIAADGSTDALFAAATRAYALHGQRIALSVRGVPLLKGVPLQQETLLLYSTAQDEKVL